MRLPTPPDVPSSELTEVLGQAFINLLDLTIQTFRHQESPPPGPPAYNVLLTMNHMYIFPRSRGYYSPVADPDVTGETKEIAVNALGFAGMLMVKCEEERDVLLKAGVLNVLKGVGLADAHGESCAAVEGSLVD